jgi:hypothetical protein
MNPAMKTHFLSRRSLLRAIAELALAVDAVIVWLVICMFNVSTCSAVEPPPLPMDPTHACGEARSPATAMPHVQRLASETRDFETCEDLDDLQRVPPGKLKLEEQPDFWGWRADRRLTEKQMSRMRKLTALVLDERARYAWREWAIEELGQWGHRDAIPALIAGMRHANPALTVRRECLFALSKITDKRVIEPLIEAVADVTLGYNADDQLRKITHANWGGWNTPDQAEHLRDPMPRELDAYKAWLRRRQERWRQWWKEHGDKTQLDRKAAFEHSGPM